MDGQSARLFSGQSRFGEPETQFLYFSFSAVCLCLRCLEWELLLNLNICMRRCWSGRGQMHI